MFNNFCRSYGPCTLIEMMCLITLLLFEISPYCRAYTFQTFSRFSLPTCPLCFKAECFFQAKGKLYLDSVLVDDNTLIVATETRKIKKINLDSMIVYQTFQGLTPPNEVRLILANHGKGNR